jgi:hypothetical protein
LWHESISEKIRHMLLREMTVLRIVLIAFAKVARVRQDRMRLIVWKSLATRTLK